MGKNKWTFTHLIHEFPSQLFHLCEYGLKEEHIHNAMGMFGALPYSVLFLYRSSSRGGNAFQSIASFINARGS